MKGILLSIVLALASVSALAHPGHGEPGWFHRHEDLLVDVALTLLALATLAAGAIAVRRRRRRGTS